MARKTRLSLPTGFSRELFRVGARPFKIKVNDREIGEAVPRENSTGSVGWRCDTKMQVKIGDQTVWVQVGLAFTVIGSGALSPAATTQQGSSP